MTRRPSSRFLGLVASSVAAVLIGGSASAIPSQETSRYIVVLDNGADVSKVLDRHVSRFGIVSRFTYSSVFNGYAATIPRRFVQAVSDDADVRFVTPDLPVSINYQEEPTGVRRIHASAGPSGGEGVVVAVLDTGIDPLHPDLKGNIAGFFDCVTGADPIDLHGHGTHVAGTIVAVDNTIGVVGVAPKSKLWAVRVIDDTGSGFYANVICGLEFVHALSPMFGSPSPIHVVNMSIGGDGRDDGNCGLTNGDAFHLAVCNVVSAGVTVVVAAGNDGYDLAYTVPAAYNEAITVTALGDSDGSPCGMGPNTSRGADDTFPSFSNYPRSPDLAHTVAGPGVDILSTYPQIWGSYKSMSGTSMASPAVAGAAAVYISRNPGATPAEVLAGLKSSGESPNVNFKDECVPGVSSHRASGIHPEEVIRLGL